jgi:hypothetical protein
MAARIMEVTADNASWKPTPNAKLYLDVHHLGAGKVTARDVAAAHEKDLAVGRPMAWAPTRSRKFPRDASATPRNFARPASET